MVQCDARRVHPTRAHAHGSHSQTAPCQSFFCFTASSITRVSHSRLTRQRRQRAVLVAIPGLRLPLHGHFQRQEHELAGARGRVLQDDGAVLSHVNACMSNVSHVASCRCRCYALRTLGGILRFHLRSNAVAAFSPREIMTRVPPNPFPHTPGMRRVQHPRLAQDDELHGGFHDGESPADCACASEAACVAATAWIRYVLWVLM